MTDNQWEQLLKLVQGEALEPMPVGFIVDSPWLPGWAGENILDYYTDDRMWLEINFKAVQRFPEAILIPGFWAEFGMCTEPAAFGARCVWHENEFPFAEKVIFDYSQIDHIKKPNCRTDGLCPFVIRRLQHRLEQIEQENHRLRIAASRGPHNIASFLLGHTEFLMGMKVAPQQIHKLIQIVTDFVIDWLNWQLECFPTMQGILVLDDLLGFIGEADFQEFALPYFSQIANSVDVPVKILHNDAKGLITAKYLKEMGFNVFNFSHEHSLSQIRELAGEDVVLMGNLPPRDVLAGGTPEQVRQKTQEMIDSIADRRRILWSCGGGMPPGTPTANIDAFIETVKQASVSK